jgi:phage terminase small subunit
MTDRRRRFVDLYLTTADGNATQAAREAGFSAPSALGSRLVRQLREVIAAREVVLRDKALISAGEVQEKLSQLARDPDHKDHFRALELMAKIHGLLSEKLDITVSRKQLRDDVTEAMGQLAALSARKQPQLPPSKSA